MIKRLCVSGIVIGFVNDEILKKLFSKVIFPYYLANLYN
ncbi:protein of unknown function [Candidatus Nitrosocosmicus franklandus]|uniref:Uncharacterized protein n=1 Tax=Candidatus Nitrosocosmicus franklandianus TaxID=1798806 RepID=A0A484ID30_9ARCH|nr:protein of unknown function [Candidatus Nitrosocosmicus franklandus]